MAIRLPEVCIIMATYNGEDYLIDQLESIKNQIGVEVSVLVVDDGSTDSTLSILESYRRNGLIFKIIQTDRVGHSVAFMTGLNQISTEEWVGFSDQDDIWDSTKLINSIKSSTLDEPVLISGGRTYIDNRGKPVGRSVELRRPPSWRNALVENICYGNTILINRKGIELINGFKGIYPEVFDAWLYLVFALRGRIVYLKDSGTKYRLHESNTIGVGRTWNLRLLINNQQRLIMNGFLLLDIDYGVFGDEFTSEVEEFRKFMARKSSHNWMAPFRLSFFRQNFFDHIILKLISPWVYSINRNR
jgi:glycosyltransferase involved in cell wall biosynthesis